MKFRLLIPLALLLSGVVGCKRYAMGEPFKNPPPPILKRDWQSIARKDLSFTIAIPPGAEVLDMPGTGSGPGAGMAGLGGILGAGSGESEDEAGFMAIMSGSNVGLDEAMRQLAQTEMGMKPTGPQTAPPPTAQSSRPASKPFTGDIGIIIFAEMPAEQSYEALADEVESRINEVMPVKLTIDKKKMDLPVGPAMRVKADYWDATMNQGLTMIVYTLSNGKRLYAGFFMSLGGMGEEAGFSPLEIMTTFRGRG